jgi:phosphoenolpyruvate carboxykinase (GTP)
MSTSSKILADWVHDVSKLTQPKDIHWCSGSKEEYTSIVNLMLETGDFIKLNEETHPGCYLHRSNPNDVARVEHLTFVCTKNKSDAGPNNHWMSPEDGHEKMNKLFAGSMKGRTLYVIPYCMGPIHSPYARLGVEITDSPYVVANMHIMTRSGQQALARIEKGEAFVKGLHSTGDLSPDRRFIMHFPEELAIKSIGSGYGGNALLGKKCHSLRIASFQARQEGWLAEHMLILCVENPKGEKKYLAAAFPSACGKTNLAMLIPPELYKGYKIYTIGDDICWMHLGKDGRLYAINPENGYFGVAPGTSDKTNPNALAMLNKDAIFTNVALTKDGQPWWEGLTPQPPEGMTDWQGKPFDPKSGSPAAHANSRFTVSMKNCPSFTLDSEKPEGVPISAIVFGGRRKELAPLVFEAKNWASGVLVGASVASETTAAATGQVGIVRRDPMAMQPFCGYNFADYWSHWLSFGKKSDALPKVFHVNWFRKNKQGKFIWPGFGDNMRVIDWIFSRCDGKVGAKEEPIGYLPHEKDINLEGLKVSGADMTELLSVSKDSWKTEVDSIEEYFFQYGDRLPKEFRSEISLLKRNLT